MFQFTKYFKNKKTREKREKYVTTYTHVDVQVENVRHAFSAITYLRTSNCGGLADLHRSVNGFLLSKHF